MSKVVVPLESKVVPQDVSLLKNFVAGGFGGMCLVIAGHPFDTVKVRLQTATKAQSSIPFKNGTVGYTGALDCFRKTFRNEGILGFYKGMGTPVLMVTPLFALGFFGYSMGKRVVSYLTPNKKESKALSPFQLFCAGAISGCATTLIVCPVERIKCLLQVQVLNSTSSNSFPKYNGPLHCGQTLLKEGGIQSLYRGLMATYIRAIPQVGLYYMTYDVLKEYMGGGSALSPAKTLVAGGLTGIINWVFVLPLDCVKNIIQTAPDGKYPRGFRDVFPQLLKTEGVKGFYRGIVPVFIRAFPANAACFMGFESAIKFLNFIEMRL